MMHLLLRSTSMFALLAGIALSATNSAHYAQASLSSHGSTVLDHPAQKSLLAQGPLPAASFLQNYEQTQAAYDLVLGMLLILVGFLLHTLLVAREERPVRVRVVPGSASSPFHRSSHSATAQSPSGQRVVPIHHKPVPEWFWVELHL